MGITLIVALFAALMLIYIGARMYKRKLLVADSYTITLGRGRDIASLTYREPSGRTLTLEVHDWRGSQNQPLLLVDFPLEVVFYEDGLSLAREGPIKLDIPDSPSQPISEEEAARVKERISAWLTRLKIQHEFAPPRRDGWTSFENGKEIYRG
jgi:hypothetical protein